MIEEFDKVCQIFFLDRSFRSLLLDIVIRKTSVGSKGSTLRLLAFGRQVKLLEIRSLPSARDIDARDTPILYIVSLTPTSECQASFILSSFFCIYQEVMSPDAWRLWPYKPTFLPLRLLLSRFFASVLATRRPALPSSLPTSLPCLSGYPFLAIIYWVQHAELASLLL